MTLPLRPAHAVRYAALARLLIRHGRSDVVTGAGSASSSSRRSSRRSADLARDLADLERWVRPSSSGSCCRRVDLLPPATLAEALTRLQDRVDPFPFAEVKQIVEDELVSRSATPSASFDEGHGRRVAGPVHRATLRSGARLSSRCSVPASGDHPRRHGRPRPPRRLRRQPHGRGPPPGFGLLLGQFRRSLAGSSTTSGRPRTSPDCASSRGAPHLLVPEPVPDYTSSRVLDELRAGAQGHRRRTPRPARGRRRAAGADLFAAYLHMILVDGFLHADPHRATSCSPRTAGSPSSTSGWWRPSAPGAGQHHQAAARDQRRRRRGGSHGPGLDGLPLDGTTPTGSTRTSPPW